MRHRATTTNSAWISKIICSQRMVALGLLTLFLSACGGGGGSGSITDNVAPEPSSDGIPPTLTEVKIYNGQNLGATAELGQRVTVEFTSDEPLMTPKVIIGGVSVTVTGSTRNWEASRNMNQDDVDGMIAFSIAFSDPSGEVGVDVAASTDDSSVEYCAEGCIVETPKDPIVGRWKLSPIAGALGVGPSAGDTSWFATGEADISGARACHFDDEYYFGEDGTFKQTLGAETWVEVWQGATAEGCATPVAPHDGTVVASYSMTDASGDTPAKLTISGLGAHLGLAKVVNGAELASPGDAPKSVTYDVALLAADGSSMTVRVNSGPGVWEFKLVKIPPSPVVGAWKLAPVAGALGVGPAAGDTSWFSTGEADVAGARACHFDDIYYFAPDGTFSQTLGSQTWVEVWQGAAAEGCATPVAPHNGSANATYSITDASDDKPGQLIIQGMGAHLGLAKVINGAELASPGDAPASITYDVAQLAADGTSMTVRVNFGPGVWEFKLVKIPPSPLIGNWKLAPVAGALGVGPGAGDTSWFATGEADVAGARACHFDDVYNFGADGSFKQTLGTQTWVEVWQGAAAEGCAAPVAPHDGSAKATYSMIEATADSDAQLVIYGLGAHLGLAKVVNGSELADPGDAPSSVTYDVATLAADGTSMTVRVNFGPGVWEFKLVKILPVKPSPLHGSWKLAPVAGALGVGPSAGDTSWFTTGEADVAGARGCHFDDIYTFGTDGSFTQTLGEQTWVEGWQGASAEGCGSPVAPHDGTASATYTMTEGKGDSNATLEIEGIGAHLGLAKVINGGELASPGDAPASVTYDVALLAADGSNMTVRVDIGGGVWEFKLAKIAGSDSAGDDASDAAEASPLAGPWGVFGGAEADPETYTYSNPAGAESWSGFANENTALYPFNFPNGGSITFTGAVPSGGDANVRFKFERAPHPDVDPAFETDAVVVSGATEATYTITFAAQDVANTFSSFLMYVTERDLPVVIKDVKVIAAGAADESTPASPYAGPWGSFGNAVSDADTKTYSFPTGAEGWAGFANDNSALYPFSFPHGGTITFTGSVPSGGAVNVNFKFERLPHPDVDPAFATDAATVTGATDATYKITIAPQDAANTFSSLLMYIAENDIDVVIKDVMVEAHTNSLFAGPWGSFGNATADADTKTYSFPTGAETWAGFANENSSLYPFGFQHGGSITFTGSVPSGGDVNVSFKFERMPHPDVDPAFATDAVTVSGVLEVTYTIAIAPQNAANTFSSLLMYIVENDVDVTIKNVLVTANANSLYAQPWGPFGNATADTETSTYSFPSGAETWAGFANDNSSLYPYSFANGGTITFKAAVPSGGDVNISFKFERLPHPDVDPAFTTDAVTVSGASETSHTVTIAPQDAGNTFSSLLMYIAENDLDVVVKQVLVTAN